MQQWVFLPFAPVGRPKVHCLDCRTDRAAGQPHEHRALCIGPPSALPGLIAPPTCLLPGTPCPTKPSHSSLRHTPSKSGIRVLPNSLVSPKLGSFLELWKDLNNTDPRVLETCTFFMLFSGFLFCLISPYPQRRSLRKVKAPHPDLTGFLGVKVKVPHSWLHSES